MKRSLMTATAVCALALGLAACAGMAMDGDAVAPSASTTGQPIAAETAFPATPEGATAFVAEAETRLAALSEEAARIQWTRATNITHDTMWLESRINAEYTELQVELANKAAAFNDVAASADVRRKLNLLRLGIVLPAPNRPGAATELAEITTRLDSTYATGKFEYQGRQLTLDEANILIAESRDPAETRALYEGWRTVSPVMAADYTRMVEIANEGSRELGFADTGAMWRAGYDMEPDAFAAETDRLWEQVKPFYENLHCYVRGRLNAKYGDAVQPDSGPIRADLLG
ncbi:MAG: peptidase M2 family protein, partial [Brevundimonas sp.]